MAPWRDVVPDDGPLTGGALGVPGLVVLDLLDLLPAQPRPGPGCRDAVELLDRVVAVFLPGLLEARRLDLGRPRLSDDLDASPREVVLDRLVDVTVCSLPGRSASLMTLTRRLNGDASPLCVDRVSLLSHRLLNEGGLNLPCLVE